MKDQKTLIAVLLSIVVVIVAFYIRVSPEPADQRDVSIEELASSTSPTTSNPAAVPPAPGNTVTPPARNDDGLGPQ
jgi:hypothetical protein